MEHTEIEVKFHIADQSWIRQRILDRGGETEGREFETNIRLDDKSNSLLDQGALLRLRKDAGTRLTYKSIPSNPDQRFKVFNELEIEVSDFDSTKQIMAALGFEPRQVYEKWRETFYFGDMLLCLDEMPFGVFLEIEGAQERIRPTAANLGLDWEKRILKNYLEIFAELKTALNLSFSDVTFENFQSMEINPGVIKTALETILPSSSS